VILLLKNPAGKPILWVVFLALFVSLAGCKRKGEERVPPPRFYLLEAGGGVLSGGKVIPEGGEVSAGTPFALPVGTRSAITSSRGDFLLLLFGPAQAQVTAGEGIYAVEVSSGQGFLSSAQGIVARLTLETATSEITGPSILYFEARPEEGYLCLCEGKGKLEGAREVLHLLTPPGHQGFFFTPITFTPTPSPIRHRAQEVEEVRYLLHLAGLRYGSSAKRSSP
jgi:hypothetical protein